MESGEHLEQPLVTFALVAYNQKQYVKEAIEGAFKQTYSRIEIILSDDNSSDGTFEIMQEEAEKYTGCHKVILNRNQHNQGLTGHINKIMELAHGELIVIAAGDDISLPERVRKTVDAWHHSDGEAFSIHADIKLIDCQGNSLSVPPSRPPLEALKSARSIAKANPALRGPTHAWHRSVFDRFPPLNLDVIHEDVVLPFRSALLGKIIYLDEPLVLYRVRVGISKDHYAYNNCKELLYETGREVLERFKIDAIQKHSDALHFGRDDLVVLLEKRIKKIELSLMFASREYGILQILEYALKKNIGLFVILAQFIKYKTPMYCIFQKTRDSLIGLRKKYKDQFVSCEAGE